MIENSALNQRIESKLKILGAEVLHKVEYPRTDKKLLDYVIKKDGVTTFIKVTHNINTSSSVFKELKRFTNFLNMNALIVADKINEENVIDGVLHIKDRVGIVQVKTILNVAKGEKVYIYEFKGAFYVKIDGRKLRELRERKGYGLSELAKRVGASMKALHMYEEGLIDMTVEKAYRFIEIFDKEFEEALKEVDIFRDRIQDSSVHRRSLYNKEDEVKQKLAKIFSDQGADAEIFNYLPSDLIVSKKGKRLFVSLIDNKVDSELAIIKAKENKMFSKSLEGVPVNIVNDNTSRDMLREIENYGITLRYGQIAKRDIEIDLESEIN